MSGSGKSARPVRQLSLQSPTPRRQQIRRQRSAEDDKSLQICASTLARGKHATGKLAFERPKVRVAWSENRRKSEKELEQVEVVARQIPGRARPSTGKSRGYIGIEKPPILCSRQELAERLRLAWKHREENKTNINIVLTHGTEEERCDSEMSSYVSISTPPSPFQKSRRDEAKITPSNKSSTTRSKQTPRLETRTSFNEVYRKKGDEDVAAKSDKAVIRDDDPSMDKVEEKLLDCANVHEEMRKITMNKDNEISEDKKTEGPGECVPREMQEDLISGNLNIDKVKKKPSMAAANVSSILPSIKIENSTTSVAKTLKNDFSSAKQKRASFHSGANRAFLDPIRSEYKWNSMTEKVMPSVKTEMDASSPDQEVTDNAQNNVIVISIDSPEKCATITEKSVASKVTADTSFTTDRNARAKTAIENRNSPVDDKVMQKTNDDNKIMISTIRRTTVADRTMENKNDSTLEEDTLTRQTLEVIRCNSVNEKFPASKRMENQRIDRKSRRTNSAPPQKHMGNLSSNRLQVNIVIDTASSLAPGRLNEKEKISTDDKNFISEEDVASTKVLSQRVVRSAPSKRRSRSVKKRFCGAGSCKHDEDGKSRNRSAGRGKNPSDARTIDIVTMVSLVSSADSDSDTENSPRDDKLIDELRSKLPTTSIIKPSMNTASSITRKPIKSVSFQRDSFDEDPPKEQQPLAKEEKKTIQPRLAIVNHRGNGGCPSTEVTPPWRTDIPGLALPVLALIHDAEETHDVPLTDREKRCLAVPIGDLHDKKRKLLKTRSNPLRSEMEKQTASPKIKIQESLRINSQKIETFKQHEKTSVNNSPTNAKQIFAAASRETTRQVQLAPAEPQFQTNKEKECWHLYRKMCDKGVCVSFDTVLRGMLTPTEYRLRQKKLFQD